jgi:heme O synthase-like polyprenyltransferase
LRHSEIALLLHSFFLISFTLMLSKVRGIIQLLRPTHWIKNVIVFMPMVFSGKALNLTAQLHSLVAFLFFSLAASLVYAINDLADVERDRLHPIMRLKRPLAYGALSTQEAFILIAILFLVSLSSVFFSQQFFFRASCIHRTQCCLQHLSETSACLGYFFCFSRLRASRICGRSCD